MIHSAVLKSIVLLITMGILLIACNSPKKFLEGGNYEKAFQKALNSLEKDKGTRDDKNVLIKAFNEMLKETYTAKEQLGDFQEIEDAIAMYDQISGVNTQYNLGKQWLKNDYETKMRTLNAEQEELRVSIAESFWTYAQEDIASYQETGVKAAAQSAYANLQQVKSYNGDYAELDQLTAAMYDNSIINVAIYAAERFGNWNEWDIDREFDDLARRDRGWYRFDYKPINADGYDCVMEIQLYDLDLNRYERSNVENFSKEIEDGYTTKIDTSGNTINVPIYRTVTGSASVNTITTVVEWSAAVQWSSQNGDCQYYSQRFNEEEDEACQIIQTSGDERAIPNQYLNQYSNVNCDFEDRLREEVLEDLVDAIAREYF